MMDRRIATTLDSRRALRSRWTIAAVLAPLGLACASYPARTEAALRDFQSGRLSKAREAYEAPNTTGSPFLAGAEAGTVALAAGDWDRALADLGQAAAYVRDIENSALVSPESLGESLLSWAINDTFTKYEGEGYERVMLHGGLAMAYLAKGDFTAAQVEVRRSNALLESEEKLYSKEYRAGGLGHFLSAVAYELDGKPDDAYIDYRRMEAKGVGTELASRALVRLGTQLGHDDDVKRWKEQYHVDLEVPGNTANVVVIAGVGLGPYKIEHSLVIPLPDGFLSWAVPSFQTRPQPVQSLEFSVTGGIGTVQTAVLEDVDAVAKENLDDRIAWLAAKSAVRAVLKRELTKELNRQAGTWGEIIGDVFSVVSERADLRAWQTLPASWQAARVFLPPGQHELVLDAAPAGRKVLGTFELEKGETMFIFARTVGTDLYAHVVGGRRVTEVATARPSGD